MRLYSVNPVWPGARSRHHYVVAATDEIDAARQVFDIMKPTQPPLPNGVKRNRWERMGPPPEWRVSKVFTPEEFKENLDCVKFSEESGEGDDEASYDVFSDMLYVHKVVRL